MLSGIARITLFSSGGEPVSERMIFIQNYDQLKVNINSSKPAYAPREKVSLDVNALNGDDEPVAGHFSVAVTDETKVPVDVNNENTIITSLLLTSDVKGYVEQPNYYFYNSSPETMANLDVLMLTQAYRGFQWKQVLTDTTITPKPYQPEYLPELSGTVKTPLGKPVPGAHITLLSTKENFVRDTITDAQGAFKFNDLYLMDTVKLVLHAIKKNNGDNVNIVIDKPDYPSVTRFESPDTSQITIPAQIASEMHRRYEQQSGSMRTGIVLKQVSVKSIKDHPWEVHLTHSDNLNGPGNANQVIMGDKLVGCASLADCLIGKLYGVKVVGKTFYSLRTTIALNGPTKPLAVMVDGIIRDQTVLDELSYTDVYSIEVLLSYTYLTVYGSQASGGLLVITTKRGDEPGNTKVNADGSVSYTFYGLQKVRKFYSPKYAVVAIANQQPDTRTTIYWNPDLSTDEKGNASFDFFNAGTPGIYRVVIEGMDDSGNIGRHVFHYTVK